MTAPRGGPPLIAAALVVRDEARQLAECLAGLAGVVDEIVVHDTGSVDGTVAIARAAGAVVLQGHWDDDFARARNAALELAGADWVLVLDADERVRADPSRLRALLQAARADVLTAQVHNVYPQELGGSYRHPGPRLLRRGAVRYVGRVHEQPVPLRPGRPRAEACPADVLEIEHLGYADAAVVREKAARNAAIAQAELDRLRATPGVDPQQLAKVLLDLGRSLMVSDRRQAAVDAFEALRELAPGSRRAVEGTDALARLLLGAGLDHAVLVLAEELRAAGTDGRYCDWLRAQALAQLGRAPEALVLLRGVDLLRDAAGRELDLGQVLEVRALVAALCGASDEAVQSLAQAVTRHGRVRGRGGLLLELWADRPAAELAALLADLLAGPSATPGPVVSELAGCRPPGPQVADLLLPALHRRRESADGAA